MFSSDSSFLVFRDDRKAIVWSVYRKLGVFKKSKVFGCVSPNPKRIDVLRILVF
jgi:hypothetical protein